MRECKNLVFKDFPLYYWIYNESVILYYIIIWIFLREFRV